MENGAINYGDFVLIKCNNMYLSVSHEFETQKDDDSREREGQDVFFRKLSELGVMDINYFLFQILPNDETLPGYLFGEEYVNNLDYIFSKDEVFKKFSEKFKFPVEIPLEKEVRLFNPFLCAFLAYDSKLSKDETPIKLKRQVDGVTEWNSLFKLKVEAQVTKGKMLNHNSTITFQAGPNGDYTTSKLFFANSQAKNCGNIKKFQTAQKTSKNIKEAKTEFKSLLDKIMVASKFMSYKEYRSLRYEKSRRFLTPLDYFRVVSNFDGELFFLSPLLGNDDSRWNNYQKESVNCELSYVSKYQMEKTKRFSTIFQLLEHENLDLKKSRGMSMYSLPFFSSDMTTNIEKYKILTDIHYTLNLPFNMNNFDKKQSYTDVAFPYSSHMLFDYNQNEIRVMSGTNKPKENTKMFFLNKVDDVGEKEYFEPIKEDTTFYIGYAKEAKYNQFYFLQKGDPANQSASESQSNKNYIMEVDGLEDVEGFKSANFEKRLAEYEEEKKKIDLEYEEILAQALREKKARLQEDVRSGVLSELPEIIELSENEIPYKKELRMPEREDSNEEDMKNILNCAINKNLYNPENKRKKFEGQNGFSFNLSDISESKAAYSNTLTRTPLMQNEILILKESEVLDIYRLLSLKKAIKDKIENEFNQKNDFQTVYEKIEILNDMFKSRMEKPLQDLNDFQDLVHQFQITEIILEFLTNNFSKWLQISQKVNDPAISKTEEDPKKKDTDINIDHKEGDDESPKRKQDDKDKKKQSVFTPKNDQKTTEGRGNTELTKERISSKPGTKKQKDETKTIRSKDCIIEFFEHMCKNNPFIKNWFISKMNSFFTFSQESEIMQNFLVSNMMENNKNLEDSINLEQIFGIWEIMVNQLKSIPEDDFKVNNLLGKIAILKIFNKIYKDISLMDQGTSLITFLKFFINEDHIRCILSNVTKEGSDKFFLSDFHQKIYKRQVLLKNSQEQKEQSEVLINVLLKELVALTYHIPRVSNVYFLTQKILFDSINEDTYYNICLDIVRNVNITPKVRAEILELISTLFFHDGTKFFPDEMILLTPHNNFKISKRINDMRQIYIESCKNLLSDHIIMKTLIQKKMIIFDSTEQNLSDAISQLLLGYRKIAQDLNSKPNDQCIENISKSLARLCDAYSLAIAKNIYKGSLKSNFNEKYVTEKLNKSVLNNFRSEVGFFINKSLNLNMVYTMQRNIENISKFTISFTDIIASLKTVFVIDTKVAEEYFDEWKAINLQTQEIRVDQPDNENTYIQIGNSLEHMFDLLIKQIGKTEISSRIDFNNLNDDDLLEYEKLSEVLNAGKPNSKYLRNEEATTEKKTQNVMAFKPLFLLTQIPENQKQVLEEKIKHCKAFLHSSDYSTFLVDLFFLLLIKGNSVKTFQSHIRALIECTKLIIFYIDKNNSGAEELAKYLQKNEIFAGICSSHSTMFHTKRALFIIFLMKLYANFKSVNPFTDFIKDKLFLVYSSSASNFTRNFENIVYNNKNEYCLKCSRVTLFLLRNTLSCDNCKYEADLFMSLKRIYPEAKVLEKMETQKFSIQVAKELIYDNIEAFERHLCNYCQNHRFNPYGSYWEEHFQQPTDVYISFLKESAKILKVSNIADQYSKKWIDNFYGGRIYWGVTMYKPQKMVYYYNKIYFHLFQNKTMISNFKYEGVDFRDLQNSYFSHIFLNSGMINEEESLRTNFANRISNIPGFTEYSETIRNLMSYESLRNDLFVFCLNDSEKFKTNNIESAWSPDMVEKFSLLMLNFYSLNSYEKIFFKYNDMKSYFRDLDEVVVFFGYFIEFLVKHEKKYSKQISLLKGIRYFLNLRKTEFSSKFEVDSFLKNGYTCLIKILDTLIPKAVKENPSEKNTKVPKATKTEIELEPLSSKPQKEMIVEEDESAFNIKMVSIKIKYCQAMGKDPKLIRFLNIFSGDKDILLKYFSLMNEAVKINFKLLEKDISKLLDITYAALHYYFEFQIEDKFREYNENVKEEEHIGQIVNLQAILNKDLYESLMQSGNMIDALFSLIGKAKSPNLLTRVLTVCNKLLEYPYENLQKKFFNKFSSDDYNRALNNLVSNMKISMAELEDLETLSNPKELDNFSRFSYSNYVRYTKSTDLLKKILLFFKSMCEGHYQEMQLYMFEQKDEGEAHENMVNVMEAIVINVLRAYVRGNFCKPANYDLGNSIMDVIIEVIQGDVGNFVKDLIRQNEILVILKDLYNSLNNSWKEIGIPILKREKLTRSNLEFYSESEKKKVEITRKIMQFIQSVIENSSSEVIDELIVGLDWIFILTEEVTNIRSYLTNTKKLKEGKAWESFLRHKVNKEEFEKYLLPLIDFSVIKSTIENIDSNFESQLRKKFHLSNVAKKMTDKDTEEERKMKDINKSIRLFNFLKDHYTLGIEVVDNRGDVKSVHFPKPIICRYIEQEQKNIIMENLDRTSYQTKIAEFLGKKNILMANLNHAYVRNIESTFEYVRYFFGVFVEYFLFFSMIIMNALLLASNQDQLRSIEASVYSKNYNFSEPYETAFFSFTIIEIILAFFYFIQVILSKEFYYNFLSKWDAYAQKSRKDYGPFHDSEILELTLYPENMKTDEFKRIYRTMGPNNPFFYINKRWKIKIFLRLYFLVINIRLLVQSLTLFRATMYIIFSFLTLFQHPCFAPILLIIKLLEYKIVQNVLISLYLNWREFLMTIFFGLAIILIYSSIGFYSLYDVYFVYDSQFKYLCPNIWRCFITLINYGFRSGGGIGDQLFKMYKTTWYRYAARWINDFVFWLLIIVIMLNLIFGVIIDTFSDITSKVESDRLDQIKKCFICNFDKETVNQKIQGGFDVHIKQEHNMWKYIYYLIYLYEKGVMDLSSLESYVWNQFKAKKLEWIPNNRSKKMEAEESEEKKISNEISTELKEFQTIYENLDRVVKNKDMVDKEKEISLLVRKFLTLSEIQRKSDRNCYNEFIREENINFKSMKLIAYKINSQIVCEYCSLNCLLGKNLGNPISVENQSFACQCWSFSDSRHDCVRTCTGIQYPKEQLGGIGKWCKNCEVPVCKYCQKLCHKGHDLTDGYDRSEECRCNDRLTCKVRK